MNKLLNQSTSFQSPASSLTCVKVVSSVEYLIAAGDDSGNVFIFQIPKDIPQDLLNISGLSLTPPATTTTQANKPKQFCVRELHNGAVKCLEWSKNGMKLFSGDKAGGIVLTELDLIKVGIIIGLD